MGSSVHLWPWTKLNHHLESTFQLSARNLQSRSVLPHIRGLTSALYSGVFALWSAGVRRCVKGNGNVWLAKWLHATQNWRNLCLALVWRPLFKVNMGAVSTVKCESFLLIKMGSGSRGDCLFLVGVKCISQSFGAVCLSIKLQFIFQHLLHSAAFLLKCKLNWAFFLRIPELSLHWFAYVSILAWLFSNISHSIMPSSPPIISPGKD